MSAWLIQSSPGLAHALKRELVYIQAIDRKQELFIKRQRNHDLIFLNRLRDEKGIPRLRIAETVMRCPLFGRFKISKTQLQTMATELKELGPRRLVLQVAGRQFDRRDLGRWLTKEMTERGYEFSNDEDTPEVWMICIDESYYFGIPIKKSYETAGRDERTAERHGSLPPPIAAAIAFAGVVANDDVILDPVCGSGTLLAEAHAYAPAAQRIGIDIDSSAIKVARQNLTAKTDSVEQTGGVVLLNTDSRTVQLNRQDVTLVLANLPFGVQFGDRTTNPALYRDIIKNCLQHAHPEKWRAVLLTSDVESLQKALAELNTELKSGGLQTQQLFNVKIRGEPATAILIKRTK
jgi:Putative RNA methylase family UPF0020